jgi:hypothetical protein
MYGLAGHLHKLYAFKALMRSACTKTRSQPRLRNRANTHVLSSLFDHSRWFRQIMVVEPICDRSRSSFIFATRCGGQFLALEQNYTDFLKRMVELSNE